MTILKILILPMHEYGMSFQLCCLLSSMYSSLTCLVRYILRYSVLFDVIVSGTVFLISVSDSLLLVYRSATGFCILILCPSSLLNSLMNSSNFFFGCVFRIFCVQYLLTVTSFTSPFPTWILFIFFFSLLEVAWTSNTRLNKSGDSASLSSFWS